MQGHLLYNARVDSPSALFFHGLFSHAAYLREFHYNNFRTMIDLEHNFCHNLERGEVVAEI